jgi:hypothetical protein
MFVAEKQIKKNKIKRALQMIFFKKKIKISFCSVIVYGKKKKKKPGTL